MILEVGCGLKPVGDVNIDTLTEWKVSKVFHLFKKKLRIL